MILKTRSFGFTLSWISAFFPAVCFIKEKKMLYVLAGANLFLGVAVLRSVLLGTVEVFLEDAFTEIANSVGWEVDPAIERFIKIGHWYVFWTNFVWATYNLGKKYITG